MWRVSMKKILIAILALLMCFSFCSCKKKENEANVQLSENSMADIYYPKGNKVVKSEEQYQIKQPDSLSASVEELMLQLKDKLDESMEYYTYLIDADNNVSLEFISQGEYNREYILLAKAAVVETLFQMEGINSIKIKISDVDGNVIGEDSYMEDSFYFYDYSENDDLNGREITLYYADDKGEKLLSRKKTINSLPNVSIEEIIVEELMKLGTIPEKTKINSISINKDTCYIDLSKEFEDDIEGVKSEVVVYSLVNSITSLLEIENVQILIDGENVEKYRETVDIYTPLQFNKEILK